MNPGSWLALDHKQYSSNQLGKWSDGTIVRSKDQKAGVTERCKFSWGDRDPVRQPDTLP